MVYGARHWFFYEVFCVQPETLRKNNSGTREESEVGESINSWIKQLKLDEAVLFVLKEPIRLVGWKFTYSEIKTLLKTYLGFEVIKVWQDYENLAKIVSQAFGSSDKTKTQKDKGANTAEEWLAKFGEVKKKRYGKA